MQLLDLAFARFLALPPDTRVKGPGRLFQQLLLPRINLVRVTLVALRKIRRRRLLPHRLQRNLRLQRRVNLPSRLLRHHALRLSNGAATSNQAHGPKMGSISKGTPRDCIFGNKAREDRVSCVAPQFGARWSRLAPAGNVTCPKKALTIVDRD